jgi:hypothetical protein
MKIFYKILFFFIINNKINKSIKTKSLKQLYQNYMLENFSNVKISYSDKLDKNVYKNPKLIKSHKKIQAQKNYRIQKQIKKFINIFNIQNILYYIEKIYNFFEKELFKLVKYKKYFLIISCNFILILLFFFFSYTYKKYYLKKNKNSLDNLYDFKIPSNIQNILEKEPLTRNDEEKQKIENYKKIFKDALSKYQSNFPELVKNRYKIFLSTT